MEFPRLMYHQTLGHRKVENAEDFAFNKEHGWSEKPFPPKENAELLDVSSREEVAKAFNSLARHVTEKINAWDAQLGKFTSDRAEADRLNLSLREDLDSLKKSTDDELEKLRNRVAALESASAVADAKSVEPKAPVHPVAHEPEDPKKKGK